MATAMTADEYREYLRSEHWQALRQTKLLEAGRKCQVCGTRTDQLDVHHNTYARLGREHLNDLVVLCRAHHELFHKSGDAPPHRSPAWPWPGLETLPKQRLCRAGFHWWRTHVSLAPPTVDGRSIHYKQCRRCRTMGKRWLPPGTYDLPFDQWDYGVDEPDPEDSVRAGADKPRDYDEFPF